MRRREIRDSTVARVLGQPEQVERVREGRCVYQARLVEGEKTFLVRVVVDVDRDPPEVVTVYRTSKVDKYWRPG